MYLFQVLGFGWNLKKLGCKGLWRVGTGDRRREFGLHIAASCFGKNLCNVLPCNSCDESSFLEFSSAQSAIENLTNQHAHLTATNYTSLDVLHNYIYGKTLQNFVEPFDLESYGYYKINNTFHLLLMTQPATPALLVQPCKCKNCSKNTCGCSTNKSTCCSYCKCASTCKNPYKHERNDEESEDEGGK